MSKVININLFGGPGIGKSTTAAGIFYKLKREGYNVEYVPEFAKELTYGHDDVKLSDQLLIFGEQHHRIFKLREEVDIIIHDSPFIMGLCYLKPDSHLPMNEFKDLIVKMFKSYNSININLQRNQINEYTTVGRNQDFEEACRIDTQIENLLRENYIEYINMKNSLNIVNEILVYLRGQI